MTEPGRGAAPGKGTATGRLSSPRAAADGPDAAAGGTAATLYPTLEEQILGPYYEEGFEPPPDASSGKSTGSEVVDDVITARVRDLAERSSIPSLDSRALIAMARGKHRFLTQSTAKLRLESAHYDAAQLRCDLAQTLLAIRQELRDRLTSDDFPVMQEAWEATNNPLGLLEYVEPFSAENVALWKSYCPRPTRRARRRNNAKTSPAVTGAPSTSSRKPRSARPRDSAKNKLAPHTENPLPKNWKRKALTTAIGSLKGGPPVVGIAVDIGKNLGKAYNESSKLTKAAAEKRGFAWALDFFLSQIKTRGAGSLRWRVRWKEGYEYAKKRPSYVRQRKYSGAGGSKFDDNIEKGAKRAAALVNKQLTSWQESYWVTFKESRPYLRGARGPLSPIARKHRAKWADDWKKLIYERDVKTIRRVIRGYRPNVQWF